MALGAPSDTSTKTTTYDNWTFDNRLIPNVISTQFASSKTVLIAAGPPRFDDKVTSTTLHPIGLVQDFNMQQNNVLNEVYEIGSRGKYFVQGRSSRNATLSRLIIHGPSLLRAMYQESGEWPATTYTTDAEAPAKAQNSMMYINMASRFFERPTGLYVRIESMQHGNDGTTVTNGTKNEDLGTTAQIGSFYLEEVYVRAHALSVGASQTVVGENITISFDEVVPVG